MSQPPETIVCVECGGEARLVTYLPPDEPMPDGFPIAYTCTVCLHRHDLIWEDEPEE
jgi:hypothetical protein